MLIEAREQTRFDSGDEPLRKIVGINMDRPVLQNLENATVKKIEFDLLQNTPFGVGDRFHNSINFSENDAEDVLEAIAEKCRRGTSPEENVIFDVVIKGILPTEFGMMLEV